MKLLHTADLHLGKRFDAVELLEDQRLILDQLLSAARRERPDAALICGDVYDRSVPPAEAVSLLDDFLMALTEICPVLMIAGNHDSAERLSFAGKLLERQGLYVAGDLHYALKPLRLGDVEFTLLPYLSPARVREELGAEVRTMDEAVRAVLARGERSAECRQVLLAHVFVTASGSLPERSDSEIAPVGGLDDVDVSAFDGFDYVALGHIHGSQRVGRDTVRYAGSPLPYSFSEARRPKSAALVEVGAETTVQLCSLQPLRAMQEVHGTLEELLRGERSENFIHAVLTDEMPQLNAKARLEAVFPHLLRVSYALPPARMEALPMAALAGREKLDDFALFADFFAEKTRRELDTQERELVAQTLQKAGRENA